MAKKKKAVGRVARSKDTQPRKVTMSAWLSATGWKKYRSTLPQYNRAYTKKLRCLIGGVWQPFDCLLYRQTGAWLNHYAVAMVFPFKDGLTLSSMVTGLTSSNLKKRLGDCMCRMLRAAG